jgi:hypothetical protein
MALPDLTTVNEEDPEIAEQLEGEIAADEQLAAADEIDNRRISTAHSVMSGTTAKTSFSQEEISDLDPDVMVDVLPSLATAADELAKLIVPVDPKSRPVVRKEIRTLGTKHNKLFKNRMDALSIHKHSFGSTEYIQPSIVLRALLGVQNMKDVPEGPWRPDSVIYKINLAQMLNSMLITLHGNGSNDITAAGYTAIEHLDLHFASAIAGPIFKENALQLCLAILTQLTIVRLSFYMADLNFGPSEAIARIFYADDGHGGLLKDESGSVLFRHRNVLHIPTLSEEEQNLVLGTVQEASNQLISAFDDANAETWIPALGQLRADHPWEQFVDQVIQYYFDRKQDLDGQIAAGGGIVQIMLNLAGEVERRTDAREAEAKRQSFSRPGGTPKKGFGKSGIRTLKARERQLGANVAPVAQMTQQAIQPSGGVIVDDGRQRPDDGDDDVQIMAPSQAQSTARSTLEALSGLQDFQAEKAAKGKGRSLLDRQETATRVAFDDSQLTQYQVPAEFQYPPSSAPERGPYYQSPRRGNAAKRPYENMDDEPEDFDPTQDGGFEVDNRDPAAADQRRRQIAAGAPPSVRFSSAPTAGPASNMPPPASMGTPSPSKRRRKNPGSSIPPPAPPFDPEQYAEVPREDRFTHAKIAARHGTVTANSKKPAQVRTPWSAEEENALIDLIEEEGSDGISYSKLKSYDAMRPEGARLGNRSAEDMRFKARNMKETFLK